MTHVARWRQITVLCALGLLSADGVLSAQTPAAPAGEVESPRSLQGRLADGAAWGAEVPVQWNGTLLLFSHGYSPVLRAPDLAPPSMQETLLAQGYALAASAYATPGWALREAVPDQVAALDAFARAFGKPKRTIAWGNSMGGLVTVALAERFPRRIDAALPSCGSIAGSVAMMNQALDGAFAFKVLLGGGVDIELVHIDDDVSNAARVEAAVALAAKTPTGRARLALASALAQLPAWTGAYSTPPAPEDLDRQVDEAAKAFTRGVFLPRSDQERRAGGNFSWNTGVDYRAEFSASGRAPWVRQLYTSAGLNLDDDLEKLEQAPRVTADPSAVSYMRANYVPNGEARVPTLTIHTTGDGMTVPAQQAAYVSLARSQGFGDRVAAAWVDRAGHCTFTAAEQLTALHALESRLDTGVWRTTPQQMNALSRDPPGSTRFVSFDPAPLLRACRDGQTACAPPAD